jgi:hypothetical protein
MLRVLVVLLLAANALFFAWTQGWLDSVVGPARPEREPQRLAAQVRPELMQVLPPVGASAVPSAASQALVSASNAAPASTAGADASVGTTSAAAASLPAAVPALPSGPKPTAPAASASAASPSVPSAAPPVFPTSSTPPSASVVSTAASTSPVLSPAPSAPAKAVATAATASSVCLEAGPYTPAEVNVAEAALKPLLASGGWVQRKASSGGEWMIYMGPYPDREAMDRKKAELARIRGGVPQEELTAPPELARGLSLGRFPSPAAANATLAQYRLRGIRTARVVQSSSGAPAVVYLRVAQADAAMATRLTALTPPPAGRAFSACPR